MGRLRSVRHKVPECVDNIKRQDEWNGWVTQAARQEKSFYRRKVNGLGVVNGELKQILEAFPHPSYCFKSI